MRFCGGRLRRIRKISKKGLRTAAIGNFGVLPETLRIDVKPPYCRTCEFKRTMVMAANSTHSLLFEFFGLLSPMA